MKISELLKNNKFIFSCELFPPKTEEGTLALFDTVRDIESLNPGYISVTYGAGGSTRQKTVDIVTKIKRDTGIETMAHLTCVGHSKNELKGILDQIRDSGIENVIALRGDPPKGESHFKPHPDGFKYGWELTRFIRESYDFCIAVAGYPEGHVESSTKEDDWDHLKEKVSAGADIIITQLFFDNKDYFSFEQEVRRRGITIPIIPGIMPITNYSQILKFTQMCGAKIPKTIANNLESVKDDLEAVQKFGIDYATEQCKELMDHGVPGIHFYTLNKSKSTRSIMENLYKKRINI